MWVEIWACQGSVSTSVLLQQKFPFFVYWKLLLATWAFVVYGPGRYSLAAQASSCVCRSSPHMTNPMNVPQKDMIVGKTSRALSSALLIET
jgi:hypothetical protein